ncbi:hypothetical protein ES703_11375 [subsurface metagenome]
MGTKIPSETYLVDMREIDKILTNMSRNIQRLKERIKKKGSKERSQQLLNAAQVAELIGCHKYHVYSLIKKGLPVLKPSPRKFRFKRGDVEKWMKSRQVTRRQGDK